MSRSKVSILGPPYKKINEFVKTAELIPRMTKDSVPSRPLPPLFPLLPARNPEPLPQVHAPLRPLALISSLHLNLEPLLKASESPMWP